MNTDKAEKASVAPTPEELEAIYAEAAGLLNELHTERLDYQDYLLLMNALETLHGEVERLRDIDAGRQTPKPAIIEKWEPSRCPTCNADFHDHEPCNDGYYKRAVNLERCPYCGQRLEWP